MSMKEFGTIGLAFTTFLIFIFLLSHCTIEQDRNVTERNAQNAETIVRLAELGCVETEAYYSGVRCTRWRSEP